MLVLAGRLVSISSAEYTKYFAKKSKFLQLSEMLQKNDYIQVDLLVSNASKYMYTNPGEVHHR